MKKILWMFTAILICGHLYTQAQTAATDNTRVIVIQDNHKFVRK